MLGKPRNGVRSVSWSLGRDRKLSLHCLFSKDRDTGFKYAVAGDFFHVMTHHQNHGSDTFSTTAPLCFRGQGPNHIAKKAN